MLERAKKLQTEVIRLRRTIHRRPELGFQEFNTSALVAETLGSLGINVRTGIGKTGVMASLGEQGPIVAIRADMDALPIQEMNEVAYRSEVPGVMHACGHDAHVAIALGVAMLLSDAQLAGQVRFLFQPSEEAADDEGKSGAVRMVEEGALDGVDTVIALHIHDEVETGMIKIGPGPVCAAVDSFDGAVIGRGCHGAYPHLGVDPVFITGQVISCVHGIVSRHIDPMKTAVISVGSIRGGEAFNVIPGEVHLKGTIRSFDEQVREQLHTELEKAFSVSRNLGGDYRLVIHRWVQPLVNDAKVSDIVREVGTELLGEDKVLPMEAEMGGEDFAFMTREVPGAMFGLGVKKGQIRQAHSPHFDIDEEALPTGVAILAETAMRLLSVLASKPGAFIRGLDASTGLSTDPGAGLTGRAPGQ